MKNVFLITHFTNSFPCFSLNHAHKLQIRSHNLLICSLDLVICGHVLTNSFPLFDLTQTREQIITTWPQFNKTREHINISCALCGKAGKQIIIFCAQ